MPDLVMGLVKGYASDRLTPFLGSLRTSGYSGDICLFHAEMERSALEEIRRFRVTTVPFGSRLLRNRVMDLSPILDGLMRSPIDRIRPVNEVCRRVVDALSSGGSDYRRKCLLASRLLNIYCVRFALYHRFLDSHRETYDRVMITDTHDVLFQLDPFEAEIGDEVWCFLEDDRRSIRQCPYNARWIAGGFGDEALALIGDQVISCSGVTFGRVAPLMEYLELMVDRMLGLRLHMHGIDQGVHNYVVYVDRPSVVRLFANGEGSVLTMGRTTDLPTPLDADGRVLDAGGRVIPVLHQYNRHLDAGLLSLVEEGDPPSYRLRATAATGRPPASEVSPGVAPDAQD